MKKVHNQTIQKLFLHKKSWGLLIVPCCHVVRFFLCWFIQLYNADMSKFLKGSLSNPLKCWYCRLDTSVNTLVKTARLISSPKSLSVELLVCLPDPINLFRLSSTLAVMFAVPSSEHEILWTAFSVTLAPRFLIAALLNKLLCSTSRSRGMFFPLPPLLFTLLFQTNLSQSLGDKRALTQKAW